MSQAAAGAATRVQHHLLLCATPTKPLCCDPAVGAGSWHRLKTLVRELGLEDPARPEGVVLRTKADCLRVCSGGPVLLLWPEGITYGAVTPERIERIVREHVIAGVPIEEWILERFQFAPDQPTPESLDLRQVI
jgi:(2Fe-2S) ferredoxin